MHFGRLIQAILPACAAAALLSCGSGGGGADPPPPPPGSGLDSRPSNTACVAPERGMANSTVAAPRVFAGLPAFSAPVALMQAPGELRS